MSIGMDIGFIYRIREYDILQHLLSEGSMPGDVGDHMNASLPKVA